MANFKRIDIDSEAKIEGWSYLNMDGDEEHVSIPSKYDADWSTIDIAFLGISHLQYMLKTFRS